VVSDQLSFGHSSARVETKAEFVGNILDRKPIYKSITLGDPTISVVGNNAIARYTAAVEADGLGQGRRHLEALGPSVFQADLTSFHKACASPAGRRKLAVFGRPMCLPSHRLRRILLVAVTVSIPAAARYSEHELMGALHWVLTLVGAERLYQDCERDVTG